MVEGETARFAVGLSRASEQTVTVRYGTAGGTATEGTDYDRASGTHTFAPGETEKTILVQTREDALDEPDETFTVTLSNPIGATLEDGSATGTIIEYDESVPLPKLSIADTTAVEGETERFTVRLSPASEQTVTVSYRTASGTAVAGRDFDTAFGTLTFAPGNRRQSIAVPTREDDLDEPNETFTVRLNNAIGATLEDGSATGTIIDDDVSVSVPPPTLSITDATVVEGETARFAVRLNPASEQTVTVSYRTVGGTAAAGQDFDAASGTLTFAPGNYAANHRGADARRRARRAGRDVPGDAEKPQRRDPGGRECDGHDHRRRRACAAAYAFHCGRDGGRGRDGALRGRSQPGERTDRDGKLPHGGRNGSGGPGLRRRIGNAHLRPAHHTASHRGTDTRGQARRAGRDVPGGR